MVILLLILTLVIILIIFIIYFFINNTGSSNQYNNNVLNLINYQNSWNYYNGAVLVSPYVFKITSPGNLQISYFDSLGGYLQGIVNFNATYSIIDVNNIKISATSLISTATGRWPNNQVWNLEYISANSMILTIGTNSISLVPA